MEIEKLILHDNYNDSTSKNDIALLKLKTPLDLSIYTPACLPEKNSAWAGEMASVYGWGDTKQGNGLPREISPILKETTQRIIQDDECEEAYEKELDKQVCAKEKDQDSCSGDSGGPFTVEDEDEGKHFLVGVVSFGRGCALVDSLF